MWLSLQWLLYSIMSQTYIKLKIFWNWSKKARNLLEVVGFLNSNASHSWFSLIQIPFVQIGSDNSVSLDLYIKLNDEIEKTTEWMYFILVEISIPIPCMTAFIQSMVKYYVFDLGAESFYLLCPIWYAIFNLIWYKIFVFHQHNWFISAVVVVVVMKVTIRLESTARLLIRSFIWSNTWYHCIVDLRPYINVFRRLLLASYFIYQR